MQANQIWILSKFFLSRNKAIRWVHLGKAWVYRIDTEGLEIGERVKYGSEEFLCFPNGRVNERFKGFAVQIAS